MKNKSLNKTDGICLDEFFISAKCDYRESLNNFYVDKKGNLWYKRNGHQHREVKGEKWEILIPKQRLTEDDWISHMAGKGDCEFSEFIRAYFKALEMAGINRISLQIYGFNDGFRFADE